MIQINLIPDVKREFIRTQQLRKTVISLSILVGIIAGGIVVALGLFLGGQELLVNKAKADIKKNFSSLQNVENADNIITLQNQLNELPNVYSRHSIQSRLFDLLVKINPSGDNGVTYSNIKLDPTTSTVTIDGTAAKGFPATEALRKTILNTKVQSGDDEETKVPLADTVTIGETSYGQDADGKQVLRFSLSFVYPTGLLDYRMKTVKFISPAANSDVTDSNTRVPDSLFSEKASDIKEEK